MSPSSQLAALAMTLAAALPAGASTTIFTSPASFAAQLAPGSYTETFAGLNTPANNATSLAFAGGGFAYTVSQASGLYGVGTFIGTGIPNVPLTITFTSGLSHPQDRSAQENPGAAFGELDLVRGRRVVEHGGG